LIKKLINMGRKWHGPLRPGERSAKIKTMVECVDATGGPLMVAMYTLIGVRKPCPMCGKLGSTRKNCCRSCLAPRVLFENGH